MKSRVSRRRFLAGTGAVAAGLSFIPRRGWSAEEAKVNFYNWDTYIGETTLDDFQDASGIEVKMDLFADNDELFAKLKEGNPGYDLIVPTNDYVERMIIADMLEEVDLSKITNFGNIDPAFQDSQFDPGRKSRTPSSTRAASSRCLICGAPRASAIGSRRFPVPRIAGKSSWSRTSIPGASRCSAKASSGRL
jgi:spermidine/putrescine-binding protein